MLGALHEMCHNQEMLSVVLLKDLRSKNIKLDPKLQMRITSQAVGKTRQIHKLG